MANMVPPNPPTSGPGYYAEQTLYLAFQHQLSDEWWVYHGLSYIETSQAEEGETDFLLVHRTHGMFVVECKGKGVHRRPDGTWVREYRGVAQRMRESPMDQAQDQVRELTDALSVRVRKVWPDRRRLPFLFGHAVAFPLTSHSSETLPLDIPEALLFDATDLDDLAGGVQGVVDFWSRKAVGAIEPLDEASFRRFREQLLAPELRLTTSLSAQVVAQKVAVRRLNRQQVQVMEGLLDNPRLCVEGGAGTGKTVIALEAARLHAEEGRRVLLLCFNKGLGYHLESLVKGFGELSGDVQAMHFHRLCAWASFELGRGELEVPRDREAASAFWDTEAPLILLEAVEAGVVGPWDAIIIDEGQDFAGNWWPVVDSLLSSPEGSLVILQDPAQAIFTDAATDRGYPTFKLTKNLRNTKAIARVVQELSGTDVVPHPRLPEGFAPTVVQQPSPSKLRKQLDALVTRLTTTEGFRRDQLVILTPRSRKNSSLADVTELAGIPVVDLQDRRSSAITHATIGAFKGLESDVLILVDMDPSDERCDRSARYVAASRCRHLLYVFGRGDWLG